MRTVCKLRGHEIEIPDAGKISLNQSDQIQLVSLWIWGVRTLDLMTTTLTLQGFWFAKILAEFQITWRLSYHQYSGITAGHAFTPKTLLWNAGSPLPRASKSPPRKPCVTPTTDRAQTAQPTSTSLDSSGNLAHRWHTKLSRSPRKPRVSGADPLRAAQQGLSLNH